VAVLKRHTRFGMIVVESVQISPTCVLLMPWAPSWGRQYFIELQKQARARRAARDEGEPEPWSVW
jgi:hypothetical protein